MKCVEPSSSSSAAAAVAVVSESQVTDDMLPSLQSSVATLRDVSQSENYDNFTVSRVY